VSTPFSTCNLFQLTLRPEVAHDGRGSISAVRFATRENLAGMCNFLDYAELPPGTSIGDHRHPIDDEEFYLILSGEGMMRLETTTFAVSAGDLIRNPPGGLHGLSNTGTETLRLFVFEVAARYPTPHLRPEGP
jgi:mannose-6-phosphate isomerase-like protein (cupin superfamily)